MKFATRQLRAAPGFACVAALTLALGVGASSAMFALADATLLRPLPYREAERLVLIEEHGPEQAGRSRIDLLNFGEWTSQSRTFEAMAAIWVVPGGGGATMTSADGTPETVPAQSVTPQFFDVLGVKPLLGRLFLPSDDSQDPDVVVVSEGFWRNRLGADPAVVGRSVTLDGRPLTLIGIVPATFRSMSLLTFAAASPRTVLGLVIGGVARMVGAGTAIGLAAAAALGQFISAFLFGVRQLDPVTFVSVAIVLVITAAIAAAAPALRATRVDPAGAFRNH